MTENNPKMIFFVCNKKINTISEGSTICFAKSPLDVNVVLTEWTEWTYEMHLLIEIRLTNLITSHLKIQNQCQVRCFYV